MPERLPNPPLDSTVREYTTPQIGDGFFTQLIDYTQPEYQPIQRGSKYEATLGADPTVIAQFPDLYFLKETRNPRNFPYATRIWASDRLAEDSYNSVVEYVSEYVLAPAYTRIYMVRRDSYDASTTLTIGGTLTTIIAIKVVHGGSGYTSDTTQIVVADPVSGTTATADAVIDENGTIVSVVLTNVGSGYTTIPNVSIYGDGTGAVLVAIIQPQTAFLVSQKKSELNDEHPLRNEYVLITRVYETLPGPFISSQKVDQDGVVITVKKRRNICANITVSETLVGALWSQTTKTGVDNYVCEETVESRNIKIDASAAPTLETTRVDEDGKTVTVIRQMASSAYVDSITPRETISAGIWKRITSEGITDLKVWMVTETRPLPGNAVVDTKIDEDGKVITITRTLKDTTTITSTETLIAGVWTRTYKDKVSDLVARQIDEARPIPGNAISETKFDKNGDAHTVTRTMQGTTSITNTQTLIGTTWTSSYGKAISDLVSWQIVETMTVPGVVVPSSKINEQYGMVFDIRKQVVPATSEAGIISGFYTDIKSLDDLRSISVATKLNVSSLPDDQTWFGGRYHSFPPELLSASYLFAEGTIGCCDSFSITLLTDIQQYSGMCKARFTEQFFNGIPPDDVVIEQFIPKAHSFGFAWASTCSPSTCKSGAPTFHISATIHPLMTLTIGLFTTTLAATTPTVLPHGTYVMLAPEIDRWRFGVWRRLKVEVLVP